MISQRITGTCSLPDSCRKTWYCIHSWTWYWTWYCYHLAYHRHHHLNHFPWRRRACYWYSQRCYWYSQRVSPCRNPPWQTRRMPCCNCCCCRRRRRHHLRHHYRRQTCRLWFPFGIGKMRYHRRRRQCHFRCLKIDMTQ